MDPIRNPFAPGAGTPPPELAGRDDLRESLRIALARAKIGRPAKSAMLVGLRGVGKTVLLDRVREDAETAGIHTVRIEAPEGRSLPALLAPQLRQALLRLSQVQAAKEIAIPNIRTVLAKAVCRIALVILSNCSKPTRIFVYGSQASHLVRARLASFYHYRPYRQYHADGKGLCCIFGKEIRRWCARVFVSQKSLKCNLLHRTKHSKNNLWH